MHTRVQIASIAVALAILLVVFELVRRRRLGERYALLWMAAAVTLLVLAVWQGLLGTIAHAVGIYYPPNAFFIIAFGFALLLLLHFSIATSKLADETRTLAQRVALLEARLRAREDADAAPDAASEADARAASGESGNGSGDATGSGDRTGSGDGTGSEPARDTLLTRS
jgi:hypothetical protein